MLIHVEEAGAAYDELHVDGAATTSLFIAPAIAHVVPQAIAGLRGANVYVLVNGQFYGAQRTTPVTTVAILRRTFGAAAASGSREAAELALSLSQRVGMNFRLTAIPNEYPYGGALDFQSPKMKALFDFGIRCAREHRLWETPLQAAQRAEQTTLTSVGASAFNEHRFW